MRYNKGFTLPEMLITVAVLSVVSLVVFMIFNQVNKTGNEVRDAASFQVKAAKTLSIMMTDIQSMSFVMNLQREFLPHVQGGTKPATKQTFKLTNTITQSQLDPNIVRLNDKYLEFSETDYEYPHNTMTFSIGLNETDYKAGLAAAASGSITNSILVNYFLWRRDDDGDGKWRTEIKDPKTGKITYAPEDSFMDGTDNDADGLDGEEPADEGLTVGYQITYNLIEKSRRSKTLSNGKIQYLKYCQLTRTIYKPHDKSTKTEILLDNVVLLSILPFRSEGGVRRLITQNDLTAVYDADSSKYVSGEMVMNFKIAFDITLCVADPNGKVYTFQRVFTPMIFSAIES